MHKHVVNASDLVLRILLLAGLGHKERELWDRPGLRGAQESFTNPRKDKTTFQEATGARGDRRVNNTNFFTCRTLEQAERANPALFVAVLPIRFERAKLVAVRRRGEASQFAGLKGGNSPPK
jgi:hypothetical protein